MSWWSASCWPAAAALAAKTLAATTLAAATLSAQDPAAGGGGMPLTPPPPAVQDYTATGEFYEVVFAGVEGQLGGKPEDAQRIADEALAMVEGVWPRICRAFGAAASQKPKKPLRVHLYRSVAAYVAADKRLTGGRFERNEAMSHWRSKSAHVAVQPPCSDAFLRTRGLPLQTQAMLAWEACHVARYELCPNFRSHPGWFYDGLAATTAQEVLRAAHPTLLAAPFFDQRWLRVRSLLDAGRLPRIGALLADDTRRLKMRERYSARVTFFEYARSVRAEGLAELAETIRRTGAGGRYASAILKEARKHLGDLDRGFALAVQQRQPEWDEIVRSLWCFEGGCRQLAYGDTSAVAFRGEPAVGKAILWTGEVLVAPGPTQQMNLLFGRSAQGYYSVAMVPGVGVTLFAHRYRGNVWRDLGRGAAESFQSGKFVPFAMRTEGRQLKFRLGAKNWAFELPEPLPKEVRWGIGAQGAAAGAAHGIGSFGVWRDLKAVADEG
ncbi:MAG: hypothetical protein AB8H80_08390 [Planctomycetota bacterium]